MVRESSNLHIAMFPWLAFGHMIPYLNLAKLVAMKGHLVSFISTTKNIDRLPKIPPNLASKITLVKLTLPHSPGLPEGAEATSDLPGDKIPLLKISFDGLAHQLTQFLESSSSPDWLIHDFAHFWAGPLASKLGIPTMYLSIMTAPTLAFVGPIEELLHELPDADCRTRRSVEDLTLKKKWIPFETSVIPPPFYAAENLKGLFNDESSGVTDIYRHAMTVRNCKLVAVRGSLEVDQKWLELMEEIYKKPVVPIGQLPPVIDDEAGSIDPELSEWLNGKARGSVIYVAFGSEANVNRQDLTELALGLELSGIPFLWVLKKAQDSELPEGFKQRTRDRGIVYTDWAPQLKILSHESVGGFLSHSGWTSVVESISLRKPLILLPLSGDQFFNYKVLEEKKLGYAIPREESDGSFTRDAVAESVKLVMADEDGKVFRERVKEMSSLFSDRERQDQYTDKFIECLRTYRKG